MKLLLIYGSNWNQKSKDTRERAKRRPTQKTKFIQMSQDQDQELEQVNRMALPLLQVEREAGERQPQKQLLCKKKV